MRNLQSLVHQENRLPVEIRLGDLVERTLSLFRGTGYYLVGEFTYDVLVVSALLLLPMFIGIFIGNRIHTGLSEVAFRRLVGGALMLSGAALLARN